ncbi:putative MFS transporter [Bisporella sp. PMI_857]|nr:putative MFS transporter [Bisporella sp. PMI_857]
MELSIRNGNDEDATAEPATNGTEVSVAHGNLKLFSASFSFFVAGTNDGSIGALLPYILASYKIGPGLVSVLYLATFLAWLLAALTNAPLPHHLTLRALLTLGATLQLLSQALRPWNPPFPLYTFTFFLAGLGQAYQDAHANTFVASIPTSGTHNRLGLIHAMYGLGCLVSPFVATGIAGMRDGRWMLFYVFPLGLSAVNVVLVLFAFSGPFIVDDRGGERISNRSARQEIRTVFKSRGFWLLSLFYFFHIGVCSTTAGWVVEYLIHLRHGSPTTAGYIPSGFYSGLTLGRLLLAEPAHRYGERPMLCLYTLLCFTSQLLFWLIPNLVSSAVAFSFIGFFLGPFFAAGISVASRLLPGHVQSAALGMIFVTAQAGGALFPSLIGAIASAAGVKALQPIVAGLIVLMGVSWVLVPKVERHLE